MKMVEKGQYHRLHRDIKISFEMGHIFAQIFIGMELITFAFEVPTIMYRIF